MHQCLICMCMSSFCLRRKWFKQASRMYALTHTHTHTHTLSACTLKPLDMFSENTLCTCMLLRLSIFSLFFTFRIHTLTLTQMPTGTHLHNICYTTHAPFDWQTIFSPSFSAFITHTHLDLQTVFPPSLSSPISTHTQLLYFLYSVWDSCQSAYIHPTAHYNAHIVVKSPWIRSGLTSVSLCLRSLQISHCKPFSITI